MNWTMVVAAAAIFSMAGETTTIEAATHSVQIHCETAAAATLRIDYCKST
jgi:hypothetical protein